MKTKKSKIAATPKKKSAVKLKQNSFIEKRQTFGGVAIVRAGSSLAALLLSENDSYAAY